MWGAALWYNLENIDMINELCYEMMRLYSGDIKRIQHFCKIHGYAKQS